MFFSLSLARAGLYCYCASFAVARYDDNEAFGIVKVTTWPAKGKNMIFICERMTLHCCTHNILSFTMSFDFACCCVLCVSLCFTTVCRLIARTSLSSESSTRNWTLCKRVRVVFAKDCERTFKVNYTHDGFDNKIVKLMFEWRKKKSPKITFHSRESCAINKLAVFSRRSEKFIINFRSLATTKCDYTTSYGKWKLWITHEKQ